MTLTQLNVFSTVVELRSFTAAAMRLGISQSAVSHAMQGLEQELGVELVQRFRSEVEPTVIGATLLQRARTVLGLAETMRQEAADARGLKCGSLRIGSFGPTASTRLLPQLLARFRHGFPGIEIHIDEGPDRQVLQWLDERRIDIGFVVLPNERFDTVALIEDQLVAVVPASHSLAARTTLPLSALCDDPFVLTEAGSAELVDQLFATARLAPKVRYRSTQLISTLDIVARGDGITVVAELALPKPPHRDGRWVASPLDPPVRRHVGLAVPDSRLCSPATTAFIALAQKLVRDGGLDMA
ncbi:LysR family transcriptional regulator [Jeongeupia chitinilytica]|uniref:LysR family transcriptional regulator n=1 Tax=Jeongeupia chitinilytica TaxID=1041641 RepID=A0ABQ3GWX2_9NEIS|nr:LysR substrate-binding domain-containing protein [Jeongeupia chitinilytica]GHD59014.1 LysR family transcriptional regulator [Jeongeupia chitinilytica]